MPDRKLAQKAGMSGSNSNVQRYIYTVKGINRLLISVQHFSLTINLVKKAQQKGLKITQNAHLTEHQIELLKADDELPQLKSANDSELAEETETTPAAPPASISIASIKQQQLSQSIAAENEQFNYHAQTRLQQSFTEGQELGILEALAEQDGRLRVRLWQTLNDLDVGDAGWYNHLDRLSEINDKLDELLGNIPGTKDERTTH